MGACHGCCLRQRRCQPDYKRQLSATFHVSSPADRQAAPPARLNVNAATAEQLMTLPGVDRPTATNIVAHRRTIGGFRRIEDVALVSGVGAARFTHMRAEMCVGRCAECGGGGGDDVSRSSASSSRSSAVDVNTADVFQLTRVVGVTQSLAERIVSRRERRGPYRTLTELTRVRGVRPAVLSAARPYLTLSLPPTRPLPNGSLPNGVAKPVTAAADLATLDCEALLRMYGPAVRRSVRHPARHAPLPRGRVRIAVWHLDGLGVEKAANPGVREVICMTLLENSCSVLAVQDLREVEALQMLCDELNSPTIATIQRSRAPRGSWHCICSPGPDHSHPPGSSSRHVAFLYNTSSGIHLERSFQLECHHGSDVRSQPPFCAVFKVDNWETTLVNFPSQVADCTGNGDVALGNGTCGKPDLKLGCDDLMKDLKDVILLGEFPNDSIDTASISRHGYTSIRPDSAAPCGEANGTIALVDASEVHLSASVQPSFAGRCCVIRDNLTSPWIPNGWTWGGVASRHCPLWAEFYTSKPDASNSTNG